MLILVSALAILIYGLKTENFPLILAYCAVSVLSFVSFDVALIALGQSIDTEHERNEEISNYRKLSQDLAIRESRRNRGSAGSD